MAILAATLALFIVGVIIWTLFEYLVHGVLCHRLRTPASAIHWGHHQVLENVFTPPLVWVPVSIVITSLLVGISGWHAGITMSLGMLVGFAYYEYRHWQIHCRAAKTPRQQYLRDHHLAHHFCNPQAYFGVTTTVWDKVFGSLPKNHKDDYQSVKHRNPLGKPQQTER